MKTKILEIRDRNTCILGLAIDIQAEGTFGLRAMARHGMRLGGRYIMLTHLNGSQKARIDPYDWADRTWTTAHAYIEQNWDTLVEGDIIDVQFILGETTIVEESDI